MGRNRDSKKNAAREYNANAQQIAQKQQANIDKMWAERQAYSGKAEDLLSKNPIYQTPEEYAQYQQMMMQSGTDLKNQMAGIGGDLMGTDYTAQGQKDLSQGYAAATGYDNQGAGALRDIMRKGVASSEAYAKQGMETGLSDVKGFTDYYRQMAGRQEMPGQRATEAKLGRSYAEGYKALGQQAGGGANGLGAMIDLYSNKSESLADIGIQAAQYKANQEQNLGAAMERATSIRSSIYDQMSQGALGRAGALAGAEGQAAGMQTSAAQAQAEGLGGYAMNRQNTFQNRQGLLADITNQGITGAANLQGQGLLAGAQAKDTAYQFNELMPWQQGMNYYTAQISSMNPYAAQQDVYNSQLNSMNNSFSLFGKRGRFGM
jgi:hypothetical protein